MDKESLSRIRSFLKGTKDFDDAHIGTSSE